MAEGTEPIRQDIDEIRGSMTNTVDQIENRVRDNVDNTVRTVREQLDIKRQVQERPWLSLGVAVAAGFFLGSMGGSNGNERSRREYGYRGQSMRDGQAMRYYPEPDHDSDRNRSPYSERHESSRDYSSMSDRSPQSNWNSGSNRSYVSGSSSGSMPNYTPSQYNYDEDRRHRSSSSGGGGGGQMSSMMASMAGPLRDELETIARAAMNSAVRSLRESLQESIPRFDTEYQRVSSDTGHQPYEERNQSSSSQQEGNRQEGNRQQDQRNESSRSIGGYTATTSYPAGSTAGSTTGSTGSTGSSYEQSSSSDRDRSGSNRSEI